MAEYVKWRLTKVRTGVTMALFGLLAGLGFRVAEEPEASVLERAAALTGSHIPANTIGSAQVKSHSLLLSDLKRHQVASYGSVVKIRKDFKILDTLFVKMNNQVTTLSDTLAKVNDELGTFVTKEDAANTFLLKESTAVNAAKVGNVGLDGLVQGHGSVLTGELVPSQTVASLLTVPGTLSVQASKDPAGPAMVSILNNSTQSIVISDGQAGSQTISPGDSSSPVAMADGSVRTFQALVSGGGRAVTLTLSGAGGDGGLVGQALVGAP
jgi:hypothetical protein